MTVICLGPVCIPLYALLPAVLYFLSRVWVWVRKAFGYEVNPETPEDSHVLRRTKEKTRGKKDPEIRSGRSKFDKPCTDAGDTQNDKGKLRRRYHGASVGEGSDADGVEEVREIESPQEWTETLRACQENKSYIVVDFFNDGCAPCKKIAPTFAALSSQYHSKEIQFVKVNIDKLKDVAKSSQVFALPTFQIYRQGRKIDEIRGGDEDKLIEFVEEYAADI